MQKGLNTRYTIYEILKIIKTRSISLDKIFSEKIEKGKFSTSDRKFIQNVVLNTMRYHLFCEKILLKFSKKVTQSDNAYFLLISAITQLLVLKFKDFAVINTTVELSKDTRIKTSPNFINAVLRNINRNKKKLINLNYNFIQLPEWFKNKVLYWNQKQKTNFIKSISKEPNLHLVFKNKKDLQKIKIKYLKTSSHSLLIKKSLPIKEIDGYNEGLWWVQDFSAMMPLHLNNKIYNKFTADLCAAPGGKTFQLISYGAKVTAFEKNIKRAKLMKLNLDRLKLKCTFKIQDIMKINNKQKFDLIVLDAPCSSVGTIRRHPDIFFRNKSPNFKELTSIQKEMLEKAKELLNKNGIILYMVCSFFTEEGKEQIYNFLNNNKNFSLIKFEPKRTKYEESLIGKDGFYYVMPSQLNNNMLVDGFFAAKLCKND